MAYKHETREQLEARGYYGSAEHEAFLAALRHRVSGIKLAVAALPWLPENAVINFDTATFYVPKIGCPDA